MKRSGKESACELWQRAVELAPSLGLSLEREQCIVRDICDGTYCVYVSEMGDMGPAQVEKFQTRQEKTEALQLAEVRREIQRLTKQQFGLTWD